MNTIYQQTYDIISNFLQLEPGELKPDSHIVNDMGADSLALVEIAFQLSENFSIPMLDPDENLYILSHLVEHIEKQIQDQ